MKIPLFLNKIYIK